MDANSSVTHFIQRVVLRTPQGWAWIGSSLMLLMLAALVFAGAIQLPVGKTPSAQAATCLLWPFITFILLVKWGVGNSEPSWPAAAGVAFVSAAPVLYGYWSQLHG
jgi:hypothetical protein